MASLNYELSSFDDTDFPGPISFNETDLLSFFKAHITYSTDGFTLTARNDYLTVNISFHVSIEAN